jgi:hypothetical protein
VGSTKLKHLQQPLYTPETGLFLSVSHGNYKEEEGSTEWKHLQQPLYTPVAGLFLNVSQGNYDKEGSTELKHMQQQLYTPETGLFLSVSHGLETMRRRRVSHNGSICRSSCTLQILGSLICRPRKI